MCGLPWHPTILLLTSRKCQFCFHYFVPKSVCIFSSWLDLCTVPFLISISYLGAIIWDSDVQFIAAVLWFCPWGCWGVIFCLFVLFLFCFVCLFLTFKSFSVTAIHLTFPTGLYMQQQCSGSPSSYWACPSARFYSYWSGGIVIFEGDWKLTTATVHTVEGACGVGH